MRKLYNITVPLRKDNPYVDIYAKNNYIFKTSFPGCNYRLFLYYEITNNHFNKILFHPEGNILLLGVNTLLIQDIINKDIQHFNSLWYKYSNNIATNVLNLDCFNIQDKFNIVTKDLWKRVYTKLNV